MIPHRSNIGIISAMLASGLLVRDNGLSADVRPAQTETAPPTPVVVKTRQVKRWEAAHPHRVDERGLSPTQIRILYGRSRYMPHQGLKERTKRCWAAVRERVA